MTIEDISLFATMLEDLKGQLITYVLLCFILVLGVVILTTAVNELARLRGNEARERLIRQHRGEMQPLKTAGKTKKPPSPLHSLRAALTEGQKSKT